MYLKKTDKILKFRFIVSVFDFLVLYCFKNSYCNRFPGNYDNEVCPLIPN